MCTVRRWEKMLPLLFVVFHLAIFAVRGDEFFVDDMADMMDDPEPLFLSPYLASGLVSDAQQLATVVNFPVDVPSYSGFLTVNEECQAHMFFWFFPSQNDFRNDPVTVWLNGGPGSSSLVGLFRENGPFRLLPNGTVVPSRYSWNRNSSVLYVDNPVGAGFSFTVDPKCYCRTEEDVATFFLKFLDEFFRLFPDLKGNRFYLTGESYAGKYIPAIAYAIFTRSETLHLDGIAIGNGLIDPVNQLHYADHFYQLGLADDRLRAEMEKSENRIRQFIQEGNFTAAASERISMIKDVFGKKAGFTDFYNYLFSDGSPKGNLKKFLNTPSVRESIHVGALPFRNSTAVSSYLFHDIMKTVRPWLEYLIDKTRVCLYYGQMDLRDSYVASRGFISDLKWSGRESFKAAERKVWRVGRELAGYVKSYGNLTEVMVRNAGHYVPTDQPKWALDLFNRFIFNQSLAK